MKSISSLHKKTGGASPQFFAAMEAGRKACTK